jgi:hypothetical protein
MHDSICSLGAVGATNLATASLVYGARLLLAQAKRAEEGLAR